jgi:hypothetical protein
MLATVRFYSSLTQAALWFFSGGIAMSLTGALNLLNRRYGLLAPGLRRVCLATNIVITIFGIVAGAVGKASLGQFALVVGLTLSATAMSMSRRALFDGAQ